MTTTEAAEALGVTQRRVEQLVAEGKLLAERVHSHLVLLRRTDVEAFAALPRQAGWPRGKPRKQPVARKRPKREPGN